MSQSHNLIDQYKSIIQQCRLIWAGIEGKRGPKYYCVTRCTSEPGDQYGLTMSSAPKGKRWACKTCNAFAEPVWWDGPIPYIEDIKDEWAEWMAKGGREIRTF